MRRILFLAALALGSCGPVPNEGADGYEFGRPEWHDPKFEVELVTYTSPVEFKRVARTLGALSTDGGETRAFAEIREGTKCRIHIMDPIIAYEPEWMGHELAHCAYGRWHRPGQSGEAL